MSAIIIVAATVQVSAAEPAADKSAEQPEQGLQALGFSIAPKEGGKARTSMFSLVGEGYKFVYVLDRSGSMGGSGPVALRAAKAELRKSLDNLDTVHQFQLIFYNEQPTVFNAADRRLSFATDQNKEQALRFIDKIKAVGGTAHEDALRQAIHLRPDVIFFLTDGDDPKLTPAQLAKIRNMASGIVIHAIEFGSGPKPNKAGFLADLARQNGGGYVYVDISK